jgi:hypothetical protein
MEPFAELSGPRTAGDKDRIGPIRRDGLRGTGFASRALVRARVGGAPRPPTLLVLEFLPGYRGKT